MGAGGTEGTFSGDIVNDGRFVFNRSDDYDFLGAFSGSGVLDKRGEGVLTFEGDYAFQGVTNISQVSSLSSPACLQCGHSVRTRRCAITPFSVEFSR